MFPHLSDGGIQTLGQAGQCLDPFLGFLKVVSFSAVSTVRQLFSTRSDQQELSIFDRNAIHMTNRRGSGCYERRVTPAREISRVSLNGSFGF